MAAPVLQAAALTWGVLSFLGDGDDETQYNIDATAQGTNFGNPAPLIEVIQSLLTDGVLAAVTGYENRDVTIRLRISANDGDNAAQAEAALMEQVLLVPAQPLVYTPPLTNAAPTVFDVVVARLDRDTSDDWDTDEVLFGYRYYLLTLTCLPFARAAESTAVAALPPAPSSETRTVVDNCTSITGWSLDTSGSGPTGPTLVGGQAVSASATLSSSQALILKRTASLTVPAASYVAIDVDTTVPVTDVLIAVDGGGTVSPLSVSAGAGESGSTRVVFDAGVGSFSTLEVFAVNRSGTTGPHSLTVYNVATTDTAGADPSTTNRQQSRLATVSGSMPTSATIRLYDASPADLGSEVLVYTTRNTAFNPALRRWLASSDTVTPDAGAISGSFQELDSVDSVYLIPATLLRQGTYAMLASVSGLGDVTVTWQARMVTSGGSSMVGSDKVVSGSVDVTAPGSDYTVIDVAALVLPIVDVEGTNHALELTLSSTGGVAFLLDEVWLFSLDDGALTWLKDDEGLDWIEVRSPELGAARPSVWGGRNDVGNNPTCIDWKCESFGAHRFEPGTMQIFTICTSSLVSQCEIEFFPRFHSHVWGAGTS